MSQPSYLATPHDDGWARVYLDRRNLDGEWWSWTIYWPGRFSSGGMRNDKQAAADAATTAYWDAMEETPGWTAPPAAPGRPPDLVALHFWRRLEHWLAAVARREDVIEQIHRYRRAAVRGPSIIGSNEDRLVWTILTDALSRF